MFDYPVKVLSSVSGILQPSSTTLHAEQQPPTLRKGCLAKQKTSKSATSFSTSQQPKLVWATAKPSFGEIYNENIQQVFYEFCHISYLFFIEFFLVSHSRLFPIIKF